MGKKINLFLKSLALSSLILLIVMCVTPKVNAATIFSDSFNGGYNTTLWKIASGQFPPISSSFGISVDPQHASDYSTLEYDGNIPSDSTVSFDVKVNTTTPSDFGIFVYDKNGNWKNTFMFGGYGYGGTPNSFLLRESNASWNLKGAWDESIGIHHFSILFSDTENLISLNEDGKLLGSWTTPYNFSATSVGLSIYGLGSEFANFQFCDSGGCDAPTPTPSPTPAPVQLNVPTLKQTDNPWQSQTYDNATSWASNDPTIRDWGCAVTSAAMVLNYYGIQKMPDGSPVDPGTLNNWLKSQPDGYLGNGNVNWFAIPRLTYLARLAFNNPNYKYDALVYKRITGANTTTLTNDLKNNQPDILEEPHHFVVATGINNNTFNINDPYFNRDDLTNGYNNTFLNLGQYIPSYTDLSYIVLTGNASISFTATDATGSAVGESYIQQPLESDSNPGETSGNPLTIFHIDQPQNNSYTITLHDTKSEFFTVPAYFYDKSGNVTLATLEGVSNGSNANTYTVSFDKQNSSNTTNKKDATAKDLLTDIETLHNLRMLTLGQYYSLHAQARNILRDTQMRNVFAKKLTEKIHINVMTMLIKMERVQKNSADILSQDLSSLLAQL